MPRHTDGYGTLLGAHIFGIQLTYFYKASWVVFHNWRERGCKHELLCEVKIASSPQSFAQPQARSYRSATFEPHSVQPSEKMTTNPHL